MPTHLPAAPQLLVTASAIQHEKPLPELADEISQLAAHINAATCQLLLLIAEFDRRDGWAVRGVLSCAHWLNWQIGWSLGTARDKLRVAHALTELPKIQAAFAAGEVSYSKVRAMARVATPEVEDFLLNIARYGTASHMERLVRHYRAQCRRDALARDANIDYFRGLRLRVNDDGSYQISGCLPAEVGALLSRALMRAGELSAERDVEASDPAAARQADALAVIAESYLATGPQPLPERYLVHLNPELNSDRDVPLEPGGFVSAETARRVCCDAPMRSGATDDDQVHSIGRKSRVPTARMRRALRERDGGCQFPGCTHEHFVDAHHIHHWADGGETSLDNLILLCRRHHRLVHEGGFTVERGTDGEWVFRNPDAETLDTDPPCFRGNTRALVKHNLSRGRRITAATGRSRWNGDSMEYGMAVGYLFDVVGNRFLERWRPKTREQTDSLC